MKGFTKTTLILTGIFITTASLANAMPNGQPGTCYITTKSVTVNPACPQNYKLPSGKCATFKIKRLGSLTQYECQVQGGGRAENAPLTQNTGKTWRWTATN